MITNLFSIFDPTSSFFISNWVSLIIVLILLTPKFWINSFKLNIFFIKIISILFNEFKTITGPGRKKGITFYLIILFLFIVINNFLGLFPYIFTATSHIAITLSLAIPMWLSLIIYGWFNYTIYIFSHLVPQSTPAALMPFIVLIETIRNIIRPLTLAVRLIANIIAGHLLITLLGNQAITNSLITIRTVLLVQFLLLALELAVSIIQAYVFSVLITLYTREISSH